VFEAILGDLGQDAPASADAGSVAIADIAYNGRQPRQFMDPTALAALTASIRERGVLEPVLVRRIERGYELVAGERRTRAAREAGLTHVPAIVLDLDDREALEISIMENLQREDLNAVEETEAVLQLLELSLEIDRAGRWRCSTNWSRSRGVACRRRGSPRRRSGWRPICSSG
jgi:ParB family transcriptional regulator, chromosome partitioning protein